MGRQRAEAQPGTGAETSAGSSSRRDRRARANPGMLNVKWSGICAKKKLISPAPLHQMLACAISATYCLGLGFTTASWQSCRARAVGGPSHHTPAQARRRARGTSSHPSADGAACPQSAATPGIPSTKIARQRGGLRTLPHSTRDRNRPSTNRALSSSSVSSAILPLLGRAKRRPSRSCSCVGLAARTRQREGSGDQAPTAISAVKPTPSNTGSERRRCRRRRCVQGNPTCPTANVQQASPRGGARTGQWRPARAAAQAAAHLARRRLRSCSDCASPALPISSAPDSCVRRPGARSRAAWGTVGRSIPAPRPRIALGRDWLPWPSCPAGCERGRCCKQRNQAVFIIVHAPK